ncbi:hypothetical protein CN205_13940 [Sinorhizobium meliloti]|uniref:hypothetical protein n=1 Tax=Rhizobium meliloti TaxID=382 RepID=UPI000FD9FBBF|nr:hypothetical protein [Sinorhizobium meliloti]RVI06484.1 hypothetical protein CN205_13940 [Sinorhizobium meliloti]
MPASYKIYLMPGDCFDVALTYKADGTAVDLTGYSAEMAIAWPEGFTGKRGSVGSISWRAGGVIVPGEISNPSSGQISFHMDADETSSIPPVGTAAYQVRITAEGGCADTILCGNVKVYRDVFEDV